MQYPQVDSNGIYQGMIDAVAAVPPDVGFYPPHGIPVSPLGPPPTDSPGEWMDNGVTWIALTLEKNKELAFNALDVKLSEEIAKGKSHFIPAERIQVFQQPAEQGMDLVFPFADGDQKGFELVYIKFGSKPDLIEDWNHGEGVHVFFDSDLFNSVYTALLERERSCRAVMSGYEVLVHGYTQTAEFNNFINTILPTGWPAV